MHALKLGDVIVDRYRLEGMLGEGGFASVYLASDLQADRQVALKLLKNGHAGARARFDREVKIVAGLRDPHTVRFLDVGVLAGGSPFLVFETLPGVDLADYRGQLLSVVDSIRIVDQVLQSLSEAHAQGLLHRDIKPENVRIVGSPDDPLFTKLFDFGIARATDYGSPSVTKTGELVGTPRYMSPEQLLAKPLTPASDIYSVGMLLLELLLGPDALMGGTWGAQLERVRSGHVMDASLLAEIEPAVMDAIHQMTTRDPDERVASCAAARKLLRRAMEPTEHAPVTTPTVRTTPWWPWVALITVPAVVAALIASTMQTAPTVAPPPQVDRSRVAALTGASTPSVEQPAPVQTVVSPVGQPVVDPGCGDFEVRTGYTRIDGEIAYIPEGYNPRTRHPLILLMNDDYQSPDRLLRQSGFPEVADREQFLVIAPEGGISSMSVKAWREPSELRKRLPAFVEMAKIDVCIDPDRIFLVGNGEGGHGAKWASCDPWVRAMATNSFALVSPNLCDRAVPHINFAARHSTDTPIAGGPNCSGNIKLSLAGIEAAWHVRNNCETRTKAFQPLSSNITCTSWHCAEPFVSCTANGGYGWPDGAAELAATCEKRHPASFPIAEEIWAFFRNLQDE